jgi:hypothetical protein
MPSPNSFLRSCTSSPLPQFRITALIFSTAFHNPFYGTFSDYINKTTTTNISSSFFIHPIHRQFHGVAFTKFNSFLHFSSSSFLVLQFRTATRMPSPNSFLPALLFNSTDCLHQIPSFLRSCTSSPYLQFRNTALNFSTAFHNPFYGTFSDFLAKKAHKTCLPLSSSTQFTANSTGRLHQILPQFISNIIHFWLYGTFLLDRIINNN